MNSLNYKTILVNQHVSLQFLFRVPEELTDKAKMCNFIGFKHNVGYVKKVLYKQTKVDTCAKLDMYIWDQSMYDTFQTNEHMVLWDEDVGVCVTLMRYKSSYEIGLERKVQNLESELTETRRNAGYQCGSCEETEDLILDDEETGLHYCRPCWVDYNNLECIKSKQNRIYQNNLLINKLWNKQGASKYQEIENYQEENAKLNQEIEELGGESV